ncbi:MAG: hypothetical protein HOW73_02250 [Polyangiaceae bacterium]|nr:hypothetical protein [Polyangiaceae bacterium]
MRAVFSLAARPSAVYAYALQVAEQLPPRLRLRKVEVGVGEALSNAIIHGALGIESRDGMTIAEYIQRIGDGEQRYGTTRSITVSIETHPGGNATITVEDPGTGYDTSRTSVVPGRGLDIMRRCFSFVRVEHGGKRVVLGVGALS